MRGNSRRLCNTLPFRALKTKQEKQQRKRQQIFPHSGNARELHFLLGLQCILNASLNLERVAKSVRWMRADDNAHLCFARPAPKEGREKWKAETGRGSLNTIFPGKILART